MTFLQVGTNGNLKIKKNVFKIKNKLNFLKPQEVENERNTRSH